MMPEPHKLIDQHIRLNAKTALILGNTRVY